MVTDASRRQRRLQAQQFAHPIEATLLNHPSRLDGQGIVRRDDQHALIVSDVGAPLLGRPSGPISA
jgi:hypothetical protein